MVREEISAQMRCVMSAPRAPLPKADADDPLKHLIEEHWAEHDRLVAEYGDPDEAVDRIAEELFGAPEETQVLIDYLRRTIEGPDPDSDEDADDDAW